jgi:hypothetical protein
MASERQSFRKQTRGLLVMAAVILAPALLAADEFRLTIGPPVAGNAPQAKMALFVVRVDGCPNPSAARIEARAEGLVNGARQSRAITLLALLTPGVFAVNRAGWPDGVWVVNLIGRYENLSAGAIVPIGPRGFMREPSTFYPRPATATEIDAALSALASNWRSP